MSEYKALALVLAFPLFYFILKDHKKGKHGAMWMAEEAAMVKGHGGVGKIKEAPEHLGNPYYMQQIPMIDVFPNERSEWNRLFSEHEPPVKKAKKTSRTYLERKSHVPHHIFRTKRQISPELYSSRCVPIPLKSDFTF